MTEATPKEGLNLIRRFEGWHKALPDGRAKPYLCPAKVVTIGYGATYWLDGSKIKMTDEAITREVGEQLLLKQLVSYATAVDRAIKVKIHPFMRAACISLCYNIGTGAFAKSTLVRLINQKRWSECPEAFKRYKIGGGRILTGLLARRTDEAALFMRGVLKLHEVSEISVAKPAAMQKAAVGGGDQRPWWAQVAQGILNGLPGKGQAGSPAPA